MLTAQEIETRDSIDHLFRRHAGQMVSVLARRFGYQNLETIEDAVQDSLIAAMKKWPFVGQPENARAWLIETAKNRVIDKLRRSGRSVEIDETFLLETSDETRLAGEIEEGELRMIFACCHPAIPADAQIALTLKTVGGFSVPEIARAFLSNNEAIAKMLTRAKARLRETAMTVEVPSQDELTRRLDAVLKVLYLMFNEGYSASEGDELVRKDLCFEAIRLASVVAKHPTIRSPRVHSLLALFLFQGARLETRIDQNGELLLLEDQDRSLWNKSMLGEGLKHFRLSASGDELSDYHLEAEIAAVHALAPEFVLTDWPRILACYDELQRRKFSPVAELNRIIALEKVCGIEVARKEFDKLAAEDGHQRMDLFHITRAHLLAHFGEEQGAISEIESALLLTSNKPIQRFLLRKIEKLRS